MISKRRSFLCEQLDSSIESCTIDGDSFLVVDFDFLLLIAHHFCFQMKVLDSWDFMM